MPEKKAYAADTSFADDYDDTQLREALAERVRMIAQLRAHRDSLLDAQSGYMPEKKANWLKTLAQGTGNLLKTQVAPPVAAGAAGYLAAPAFQDMAGIESDMGREAQRLGTAAGAASLASPWLRQKMWSKNTLGKDLARLMKKNPQYSGFGLNEIKKLHPEIGKGIAPIRGTATTGGLLAAPTVLGGYSDAAKQMTETVERKLKENPEIVNPSYHVGQAIDKTLNSDRAKSTQKGLTDVAKHMGGSLAGGLGGSALGYGSGALLGSMLMPGESADYKELDEKGYRARRNRERMKSVLKLVGMYGGGIGGAMLGQKYLPGLMDKLTKQKQGSDMTGTNIQTLAKLAAAMGEHGLASTATGDTLGRVMTALNITPWVAAGKSSFKNPRKSKEDHEDTLKTLDSARPDALSDTELRLGGSNLWRDMAWKKERDGEDLPWHKQLGGRIMQNRRSGPLGKLLGYPTAPLRSLMTSIMRSPHYDPYSDVAHNTWDNKSVTEHELGHAIDFNSLTNKGKIPKTMLGRIGSGTLRDLYGAAYGVPFANLYHENEANRESENALKDVLPKDKFLERTKDRGKVLPASYGSYVGSNVGKLLGPAGALGPIAGAMAGRSMGTNKKLVADSQKAKAKAWDENQEKKKKPKNGDGDGKVNDGTSDEKEKSEVKDLAKAAALSIPPELLAEMQAQGPGATNALKTLGGALGGGTLGGLTGAGGAVGATVGGLKGLFSDPGEDEEGNKKSRLMAALKGTLGGGALGAAGGLAVGAGGLAGVGLGGAGGSRLAGLFHQKAGIDQLAKASARACV